MGDIINSTSELYGAIEKLYKHFHLLRAEAEAAVKKFQVPEASSHLTEVLQASQNAALNILDAATAIGYIAESEGIVEPVKQKLEEQVQKIYEASIYDDLNGQRIRKVLGELEIIEKSLRNLFNLSCEQSDPYSFEISKQEEVQEYKDPLLNGPQISSEAPSQQEIDDLFKNM